MATNPLFKTYQEDAIQAAEELMYGDKVIERLKKATTEGEVCRIMATARNKKSNFKKGTEVTSNGSC